MAGKPTYEELEQSVKGLQEESLERGRVEEQLALFRRFTEASGQGLGMADLEGRVIYANPTLCRFMGEDRPEDPLGKHVRTYYAQEDVPRLENEILPAVFKKGQETAEIPLLSLKGELTPTIQNVFLIRNDKDEPVCLANVLTDITEQKRAERELKRHRDHLEKLVAERTSGLSSMNEALQQEISDRRQAEIALRESEKKFRVIFDQTYEFVGLMTCDGTLIEANKTALDFAGLKQSDVLGRPFWETPWWTHSAELQKRLQDAANRAAAGEFVRFEAYHPGMDGKIHYFDVSIKPVKDQAGRVILLIPEGRDITDRKLAEDALRKSEATLSSIFRAGPTGVGLARNRVLERVNERICDIIGYSEEELVGQNARILYPTDEDFEYVGREKYAQIREQGRGTVETRWQRKDGELIDILLSSAPLDPGDLSAGVTFTALDITERKRAEDAVRQSEKQLRALASRLQEAEEAERKALARELHDSVGQTLTALNINLNIVRSNLSQEALEGVARRLEDSVGLVEEATSRIRDVMAELRPQVLDDYGLGAALNWYAERFEERTGVATTVHEDKTSLRMPEATESALFRIARESLTNIAKHAEATQVVLTLGEIDGTVRLTISDNGKGFNAAYVKACEEKPGWGLPAMQERAQALGGRMHVGSEPGKGTCITVEVASAGR